MRRRHTHSEWPSRHPASGPFVLSWPGLSNYLYRVCGTERLSEPPSILATTIRPRSGMISCTVTVNCAEAFFSVTGQRIAGP